MIGAAELTTWSAAMATRATTLNYFNFERMLILVIYALMLYSAVATMILVVMIHCVWCRRSALAMPCVAECRNVMTQSQTTYQRKNSTPRFLPLPERDHGAWPW
jgi:hypothetical protein